MRKIDIPDKCTINICIAADEKYAEPASVLIASILTNALPSDDIRFYILDGGISRESKIIIEILKDIKEFSIDYININNEDFKSCPITPNAHYNIVNYYRLKIPSLLPEIDKIIYLDSDIIVKNSLRDLFCVDLSNKYLAGVIAVRSERNSKRLQLPKETSYINSGVLVINCALWRDDDIENKLFQYIKNAPPKKLINEDQDAINAVLFNAIYCLDRNWNVEIRTDIEYPEDYEMFLKNPYIIHYVSSDKPWHEGTKQDTTEYKKYLNIVLLRSAVQRLSFDNDETLNGNDLVRRIDYYKQIIADRDLQIADSVKKVEELRRLIAEMHHSTSWRITAPVRFLGDVLRRFL